ncbi:MAG: amino acid permease, partial [Syntrophomonadaceae bacterium]
LARVAGPTLAGPSGPAALAAVVCVSVAGSVLALLFMAPRLYVAMAGDGLFPTSLAARTPRTGAPARATSFLGAVASALVLLGSFGQIVAYFLATTLVFVALAAFGIFRARRRSSLAPPYLVPGYPATPLLFLVFIAAVVLSIALARPAQVLAGFALVLLGVPAYGILAARGALRIPRKEGGR